MMNLGLLLCSKTSSIYNRFVLLLLLVFFPYPVIRNANIIPKVSVLPNNFAPGHSGRYRNLSKMGQEKSGSEVANRESVPSIVRARLSLFLGDQDGVSARLAFVRKGNDYVVFLCEALFFLSQSSE